MIIEQVIHVTLNPEDVRKACVEYMERAGITLPADASERLQFKMVAGDVQGNLNVSLPAKPNSESSAITQTAETPVNSQTETSPPAVEKSSKTAEDDYSVAPEIVDDVTDEPPFEPDVEVPLAKTPLFRT